MNDGFTLDFVETAEPFPIHHFCFRVSEPEFDAILGRIQAGGIQYRSTVRGPVDRKIGAAGDGGRRVYWNEPDGHQWEMLTQRDRPVARERSNTQSAWDASAQSGGP